jgi:small nuclear ribonucleoprotein (snRNP)-like protein
MKLQVNLEKTRKLFGNTITVDLQNNHVVCGLLLTFTQQQ